MKLTLDEIKQFFDALPGNYAALGRDRTGKVRIEAFSDEIPQIFGLAEKEFKELIQEDAFAFALPRDRDEMQAFFENAFRQTGTFEYVCRGIHAAKGFTWIHVKARVQKAEDEERLCFCSIDSPALENEGYEALTAGKHLDAIIHMNPDVMSAFRTSLTGEKDGKWEQEQVEQYRNVLLRAEEAMRDKNMLVAATRMMFPMCISVNLTQNSYYMIEYDNFNSRQAPEKGVFDDLIRVGLSTVPDGEKENFYNAFSREKLLEAHKRGEKMVSLIHSQTGTDGICHRNRTTAIFVEDPRSEDVLEITVTDCVDEQTKTEEELKKKESELKAALEEARKANRAKSEFLSSMSHDIRTPLNALINLTRLLRDELDSPEMLEADIQKMEVAGEFLLQLINDVLDLSAIESGKLTLAPRVYTYSTFLNYIKGIIAPLCESKDIRFILDEGPTALDIYMDRVRFHQVFFNILSNAVKYTPPGGTITFRTTNNVVHDGILTCDFIVTDTGCGMSKEFIKKAFDPFEREDSRNAYIGTGLGLAICKRILDLMGGTISIESEPGEGTTVTVHMDLLIATPEQREESHAEMDTAYHRPVDQCRMEDCRILVVEDNEINRELLYRMLEKKNYTVEYAENGKIAVEKIRQHEGDYYQLVLMDIRMPVMDGLEATLLIRQEKDERRSHIPIVAITANAFESDVQECLEAGVNSYLSKPVSPGALYEMVATYVNTCD